MRNAPIPGISSDVFIDAFPSLSNPHALFERSLVLIDLDCRHYRNHEDSRREAVSKAQAKWKVDQPHEGTRVLLLLLALHVR